MRWLVLVAFAIPSIAAADAVPANYMAPDCPARTCPPATTLSGGGHGSCPVGCSPSQRTCETDADCNTGGVTGSECVDVRWCIVRRHTSRLADVPFVEGEPDAAGNCAEGEPQIAKLCTYPPRQRSTPATSSSASDSSSGCSAAGTGTGALWMLVALLRRRR